MMVGFRFRHFQLFDEDPFGPVHQTDLLHLFFHDATAFNGLKKGTIAGKGVINNKMSNRLMQLLEKNMIPTHFVEELSDRETLVKKVEIVPLEVIVRSIAAGSFSRHYGVEEAYAEIMRRLDEHL